MTYNNGLTLVRASHQVRIERDLAQQLDIQLSRHFFPASFAENGRDFLTIAAHKRAHVLHQAQDWDVDFVEHGHPLPGVCQGYLLWRRNDNGTSYLERNQSQNEFNQMHFF